MDSNKPFILLVTPAPRRDIIFEYYCDNLYYDYDALVSMNDSIFEEAASGYFDIKKESLNGFDSVYDVSFFMRVKSNQVFYGSYTGDIEFLYKKNNKTTKFMTKIHEQKEFNFLKDKSLSQQ